eukprot:TRINITY_DN47135_c0_g1_i1.p1 TRINITY_DN47135_c0_g1~~TRINITY_DN47135_c0_g1_i1.p1  ORF type:complete len:340 (+),score=54.46 TRINITY_DN47135_c0_g1_i1:35-1021(+)
MARSPTSPLPNEMEPLRSNEYYKQGGLFDEFLQLQPAQLSWGGVVSVLSSLIQSHGACLSKLHSMEAAIHDLKGCIGSGGGHAPLHHQSLTSLERRAMDTEANVNRLYALLQVDNTELDRALEQAEIEGPNSHAQVKLLHSLPAFNTLIEDIKEVLVPLNEAAQAKQSSPKHVQVYPPDIRDDRAYINAPASLPLPTSVPAPHRMKPMVGLEIIDAVPSSADRLSSSGVRVFAVRPDGPAAAGGVQNGDCILALNDKKVTTRADLKEVMATCSAGDMVKVDLLRENIPDPIQVHIRLGTAPMAASSAMHTSYTPNTVSPSRRTRTPKR